MSANSTAPSRRGLAALALTMSIALGIGLAKLEALTCGAITPSLDVGISITPLFSSLLVILLLLDRPRLHFAFPLMLQAGMALAPLFARPTTAACFVITGLLWSMGVVACAMGHRRAAAVFLLAIGSLLTGLQLSRLPLRAKQLCAARVAPWPLAFDGPGRATPQGRNAVAEAPRAPRDALGSSD